MALDPAISILGPGGYPKEPYGSFLGKMAGGKSPGPFSVLGPQGVPRPPYGSFIGKVSGGGKGQGPFSVLGPQGVPRPPYGSFAGKVSGPPVTGIIVDPYFFAVMGGLMTHTSHS